VTEHHRFLLRLLLQQVSFLEGQLSQLEGRITETLGALDEKVQQLMVVPGISRTVAEVVLAEMGPDLAAFPSEAHLASWLGLCPGNDQSAGKRRRGKTGKGNRWLKSALVQAAWAASRSKGSYLRARFHRLAARRGRKRALVLKKAKSPAFGRRDF
jgi:transposase